MTAQSAPPDPDPGELLPPGSAVAAIDAGVISEPDGVGVSAIETAGEPVGAAEGVPVGACVGPAVAVLTGFFGVGVGGGVELM